MKKTCIKNLFSIMLILTLIFNSFSNFTFAIEKESSLSKSESIENSQPLEDDNKINEEPSVEESEESININLDKYKLGEKLYATPTSRIKPVTQKEYMWKMLDCDLDTKITFNNFLIHMYVKDSNDNYVEIELAEFVLLGKNLENATVSIEIFENKIGSFKPRNIALRKIVEGTDYNKYYYRLDSPSLCSGEYISVDCGNDTGTINEIYLDEDIPQVEYTGATNQTITYNGNNVATPITVTEPSTGATILYSSSKDGTYSETFPQIKNAGTYPIYYKISAGDDYKEASGSFTITITKASIPSNYNATYTNTYTYNGSSQGPTISANTYLSDGKTRPTVKYGTSSTSDPTSTSPIKYTDAGTYTAYYQLSDTNGNYEPSEIKSYTFTINKASISSSSNATVTNNTYTYDGTNKSATLTAPTLGGEKPTIYYSETQNGTYSATKPTRKNAGTYTLYYRFLESKNYLQSGNKSYTLIINKANITSSMISITNQTVDYTGNALSPTIKATLPTSDEAEIKYYSSSSSSTTVSAPSYTAPGTYKVYYGVKDNNNNYNEYRSSFDFSIVQDEIIFNASNQTFTYDGTNKQGEVTVSNPKSGVTIKYSTTKTGTYSTTFPAISNAGTYPIYFKITAKDYEEKEGSFTIKINKGDMNNPTVAESTFSYDGNSKSAAVTPATLLGASKGNAVVYYSLGSTKYDKTTPPSIKNVSQSATVYYKIVDKKGNYNDKTGSYSLKINKINMGDPTIGNATYDYDGTSKTANVVTAPVLLGDSKGNASVMYGNSSSSYNLSNPSFINVSQSRTVYYRIRDKKGNYNDKTGSFAFKINKIDMPEPSFGNLTYFYDGTNKAPTASVQLLGSSKPKFTYSETQTGTYGNFPSYKNAGVYDVYYKLNDDLGNYNERSGHSIRLTINKGIFEYSAIGYEGDYDELEHGALVTVTNTTDYTLRYRDESGEYTLTQSPKYTDYGTYEIWYEITSNNYQTVRDMVEVIISGASGDIEYEAQDKTVTYDGKGYSIDINVTNPTKAYEIIYSDNGESYNKTVKPTYSLPGRYTIYFQIRSSGYRSVTGYKVLQINPAKIEYDSSSSEGSSDNTFTYDGKPHYVKADVKNATGATIKYGTDPNMINLDEPPVFSDAGEYTVYFQISKDGYETITDSITFTINKGTMNISASGYEGIYDGKSHTGDISFTTPPSGASVMYGTTEGEYNLNSMPSYTDVGEHKVYYEATHKNYETARGSFVIRILQDELKASVKNYNGVYDGQPHSPELVVDTITEYTVSYGIVDESTYDMTEMPSFTNVGTHKVYIKIESNNYKTVYKVATVYITKAKIEYTAKGYVGANDGLYHGAVVEVTNPTSALVMFDTENGGKYDLFETPKYDSGHNIIYFEITEDNYETVRGSVLISIDNKNIEFQASDYNGTYDSSPHTINLKVSEPVSGYTIKYSDTEGYYYLTQAPRYTLPGIYTVYFEITAEGYTNARGSAVVNITENRIRYNEVSYDGYYDGQPHSFSISLISPKDATVRYGLEEGSYNSVQPYTFKEAGIYKVFYKISKVGYTTITGSATLMISMLSIDETKNIQKIDFNGTYDGEYHTGNVILVGEIQNDPTLQIRYGENPGNYTFASTPLFKDAGEYTVYFEITSANMNRYESSFNVNISKADIVYTVSDYHGRYDARSHSIDINIDTALTPGILNNLSVSYNTTGSDVYDLSVKPEFQDIGEYLVYYKISAPNYQDSIGSSVVSISKGVFDYEAVDYVGIFDDLYHSPSINIKTPDVTPDIAYGLEKGQYILNKMPKFKTGENIVYFKISDPNYETVESNVLVSISNALIKYSATGYQGSFDNKEHNIKVTLTEPLDAVIKYGTSNGTYDLDESPSYKEPGTYKVYFEIKKDGYATTRGSESVIITEGVHSYEVSQVDTVYDGNEYSINVKITKDEKFTTVKYGRTLESINSVTAPKYTLPGTYRTYYKISRTGYENIVGSATVRITKADIVYTAQDVTFKYDGKPHTKEVTVTKPENYKITYGLKNGSYNFNTPVQFTDAGTYLLYFKIEADNYNDVYGVTSIKINAAEKTAKFVAFDGTYTKQKVYNASQLVFPSAKEVKGYVFAGWLGDKQLIDTQNTTFYAIYLATNITKTADSSKLKIKSNYEGLSITYSYNKKPEQMYLYGLPTSEGEYTINIEINEIGEWEDIQLKAKIVQEEEKGYNVSFIGFDGTSVIDVIKVTEKSQISEYIPPIVEDYKFVKWLGIDDVPDVLTKDVTLRALYVGVGKDNKKPGEAATPTTNIDPSTGAGTGTGSGTGTGEDEIVTEVTYKNNATNETTTTPPTKTGSYEVTVTGKKKTTGEKVFEEKFNIDYVAEDENEPIVDIPNIPIYRLYNPSSGEHLFTTREGEYNKLGKIGWIKENKAFDAYTKDNKPDDAVAVYRLYNENGLNGFGDHHYTKSVGEMNKLVKAGWTVDFNGDAAFYVVGEITVYKMYNPSNGAHHYTPKEGEKNKMSKNGWKVEGTAWTVNGYYLNDGTRIDK